MFAGSRKPYVDERGAIHWPMVFVYPEVMQNDIVEDAAEQDTLKVCVRFNMQATQIIMHL